MHFGASMLAGRVIAYSPSLLRTHRRQVRLKAQAASRGKERRRLRSECHADLPVIHGFGVAAGGGGGGGSPHVLRILGFSVFCPRTPEQAAIQQTSGHAMMIAVKLQHTCSRFSSFAVKDSCAGMAVPEVQVSETRKTNQKLGSHHRHPVIQRLYLRKKRESAAPLRVA